MSFAATQVFVGASQVITGIGIIDPVFRGMCRSFAGMTRFLADTFVFSRSLTLVVGRLAVIAALTRTWFNTIWEAF